MNKCGHSDRIAFAAFSRGEATLFAARADYDEETSSSASTTGEAAVSFSTGREDDVMYDAIIYTLVIEETSPSTAMAGEIAVASSTGHDDGGTHETWSFPCAEEEATRGAIMLTLKIEFEHTGGVVDEYLQVTPPHHREHLDIDIDEERGHRRTERGTQG